MLDPWPAAIKAVFGAVENLGKQDLFGLVVSNNQSFVALDLVSAAEAQKKLPSILLEIQCFGGTDLSAGVSLARHMLENVCMNSRVIVVTDNYCHWSGPVGDSVIVV